MKKLLFFIMFIGVVYGNDIPDALAYSAAYVEITAFVQSQLAVKSTLQLKVEITYMMFAARRQGDEPRFLALTDILANRADRYTGANNIFA